MRYLYWFFLIIFGVIVFSFDIENILLKFTATLTLPCGAFGFVINYCFDAFEAALAE